MKLSPRNPLDPLLKGPFIHSDSIVSDDTPSVVGSDISSLGSGYESDDLSFASEAPARKPLQWEFKGLTLWFEFEEFDDDLTKAIDYAVKIYGTGKIPLPHATAIYGMTHLTHEEAINKLAEIPDLLRNWKNVLDKPKGLTCDIAEAGKPGQVCTIAWAELTFPTNDNHEVALDALCKLFGVTRQGPWRPHISLAYDNPEDSVLNMQDTFAYVSQHPSLIQERRIKAVSLWDTEGKMAQWQCLDRVSL